MFKLLIVDDELYIRKGLAAVVNWEQLGFEICGQAENGEQALKILDKVKPDVIITDIKMPLMGGLELIRELKENRKLDTKLIILTGYSEFNYVKEAIKYGVIDYILKPIEEEELEKLMKKIHDELVQERYERETNLRAINAISEVSLKTILKSVADKESIENVKKYLDISDSGYLRYLMIEIEFNENDNIYNIRDYLIEIIGEKFRHNIIKDDFPSCNIISYGIIITEKLLSNYKNNMISCVSSIHTKLEKKINKKVHTYVGKIVNELIFLRESYDSAMFTRSIRFYKKDCSIIYYDDIKDIPISDNFNEKFSFDDLAEAIENNNNVQIDSIIDNYFREEDSNLIDLNFFSIKINYLVYKVIKIVSKMNGETTEIIRFGAGLNFNNCITLDEVKESIKDFSHKCTKLINDLRQDQSHSILYEVEKYVQDNYCKRITIKEVANQFYINPAYLGQVFKKKYGIGFSNYVHQYRMEKAKELLKHTDFKIYEISEKLGYKSTDNFIERFQKIVGMTPLKYRKIYSV